VTIFKAFITIFQKKKNHSKAACMLDCQKGKKNKHCVIIAVSKITTLLQQEDQMSDSF